MDKQKSKPEVLDDRTLRFAQEVRAFIRKLPRSVITFEDGKQVVRSSGSVGANYMEACEALSKKDFVLRMKICRKEAKETRYWLHMFDILTGSDAKERDRLIQESTELLKICSAILNRA